MNRAELPKLMPMIKFFLPAILVTTLTACSSLEPEKPSTAIGYSCGNDFSFSAELNPQQATLLLPDQTLKLPRMKDTKGERYLSKDRKILFLRKGENAVLATGAGHHILRCKEVSD
jgi:membrane-bound inhibitor of C-type lysozyme